MIIPPLKINTSVIISLEIPLKYIILHRPVSITNRPAIVSIAFMLLLPVILSVTRLTPIPVSMLSNKGRPAIIDIPAAVRPRPAVSCPGFLSLIYITSKMSPEQHINPPVV